MLIEDPNPDDWKDLQAGVARIFQGIGLLAEVDRVVQTPRGKVELDVYAVDEQSVDRICYIVECKNWNSMVPQAVVHSFTTVMHEVGGNIGFIVTKKGLQSGAIEYTRNTNVNGMTYQQFQERYFRVWHERWFVPRVGDVVDPLTQYVEPFNSFRDRKIDALSKDNRERCIALLNQYVEFGVAMAFFEFPRYSHHFDMQTPEDIDKVKATIQKTLGGQVILQAKYMRDLLSEIIDLVGNVTQKFNDVFGENIFA